MGLSQFDIVSLKPINKFIVAGLGLAQYTDTITTIEGIKKHGILIEGNTIVSQTIQNYGFAGFIGEKIIAILLIAGITAILIKLGFKKSVIALLTSLTIFMAIVASRNLYLLFLWQ